MRETHLTASTSFKRRVFARAAAAGDGGRGGGMVVGGLWRRVWWRRVPLPVVVSQAVMTSTVSSNSKTIATIGSP